MEADYSRTAGVVKPPWEKEAATQKADINYLSNRLQVVINNLTEIRTTASVAANSLFGYQPEEVLKPKAETSQSNILGLIEDIEFLISDIIRQVNRL